MTEKLSTSESKRHAALHYKFPTKECNRRGRTRKWKRNCNICT